MKPSQQPTQPISQKKQTDKQLNQLIDSYYTHVGTVMLPVLQASLFSTDTKTSETLQTDKLHTQKQTQYFGKLILLSTGIVLICTMFGLFDKTAVLAFGLFWGLVFTRYEAKIEHELSEMLLYWMILALVTALENILSLTLFFMPFYHSLKLFLLISLLYPQINFKSRIYKDYFSPRLTHLIQSISN